MSLVSLPLSTIFSHRISNLICFTCEFAHTSPHLDYTIYSLLQLLKTLHKRRLRSLYFFFRILQRHLSDVNELRSKTSPPLPCAPECHTQLLICSHTERKAWNIHQHLLAMVSVSSHLAASSQASKAFSFGKATQQGLRADIPDSPKCFTTSQH